MKIEYGSFAYCFYIALAIALVVALYFIFRHKSEKAKRILCLTLMGINTFQHVFKTLLYPQYRGWGFSYVLTAYNMCATLILFAPLVFLVGNSLLKDFMTYVGTTAGMIAMIVPYWFIGADAFGAEQFRFYFCHTLLFASSILPCLLGLHKINYKNCVFLPLVFYGALILMNVNNAVLSLLGVYHSESVWQTLYELNSCWSIHPADGFETLNRIIFALTPNFMEGIPILWYAVPMYLVIGSLSFGLGVLFDRKRFLGDCKRRNVK